MNKLYNCPAAKRPKSLGSARISKAITVRNRPNLANAKEIRASCYAIAPCLAPKILILIALTGLVSANAPPVLIGCCPIARNLARAAISATNEKSRHFMVVVHGKSYLIFYHHYSQIQ